MKLNNDVIQSHLSLLGKAVSDVVTGFEGVVTDVSFNIDGYIDAFVKPKVDGTGKMQDGYWFNVSRLKLHSDTSESEGEEHEGLTPVEIISKALNKK